MSVEIIQGDCREVLAGMAEESVQMCVTSPPYWGLRDYGLPPLLWGGKPACHHKWLDRALPEPGVKHICMMCGAWRGSLGLEPTPGQFVEHIVEVFRAVKRVLRKDGTVWMNLGDSYASSSATTGGYSAKSTLEGYTGEQTKGRQMNRAEQCRPVRHGLKPKDLIGIPWRVAFALQADGWWLRSAIVWAKGVSFCPMYSGSVMPESCTDRPTSAYEMLFLLTKSARYYYDAEAVREIGAYVAGTEAARGSPGRLAEDGVNARPPQYWVYTGQRNLRNVWCINPEAFSGGHFATFPTKLVEPCVKAGSSPKACGVCGAPWARVVTTMPAHDGRFRGGAYIEQGNLQNNSIKRPEPEILRQRVGTNEWQPTCEHANNDKGRCVVLDPFAGGSGRAARVCKRLGRDFIGIELKAEYVEMSEREASAAITRELFVEG